MQSQLEQKLRADKMRRLQMIADMRRNVQQLGALIDRSDLSQKIIVQLDSLHHAVHVHSQEAVEAAKNRTVE